MLPFKAFLAAESRRLGFATMRVASAEPDLDMRGYDAFIAAGWHGEMEWLAAGRDLRAHVQLLLPSVRSVAVFAFDYGSALPPDPGGLTGRVASYAWGRDYHNLVLKRLQNLQRRVNEQYPGTRTYTCVDSRPVYERAWAARAGLGFPGKNACQIIPGERSTFFIAVLLLSVELEPDPPIATFCGKCRRCIDVCPTQAIHEGGGIEATRCISYLTIESDAPIPEAFRPAMGRWVFGCDDCQDVCPHQHDREDIHPDLLPKNAWINLVEVLAMSDDQHRDRFRGTPIRRAAGTRLRRNAAIVLGNIGDHAAVPALQAAASEGGVVKDAAEWALGRLG